MIAPATLAQLLAANPLAATQAAIVATLKTLLPGVSVVLHPGKVDLSELVGKSVVAPPGIGLGWSSVKCVGIPDGSFSMIVNWTAYVVAEAMVSGARRVEKEAVGLAIGGQLLKILEDEIAPFWNRTGVMPVETTPTPELKPFFTIRDAGQGTAYYVVTWTQVISDVGATVFPTATGRVRTVDGEVREPIIDYTSEEDLQDIAHWIPARQVEEDEDA